MDCDAVSHITCDADGAVLTLDLADQKLGGTIATGILRRQTVFVFEFDAVFVMRCDAMYLCVRAEIGLLTKLQFFQAANNPKLHGTLPEECALLL